MNHQNTNHTKRMSAIQKRGCLLALSLMTCLGMAQAQEGPGAGEAAAPRITSAPKVAASKIQAFTGAWQTTRMMVGLTKPGVAPLKPEYNAKLEELAKLAVAGNEVPGNEPNCIPNGPIMDMNFGFRVFADAAQMAIISSGPRVRYVWLDGRKHTNDDFLFETYGGEGLARMEGDELVIDTIGLKDTNEIVFGIASGGTQMHLVERWKINREGLLEIQTTIEDPVALTKPWTIKRTYRRVELGTDITYCVPATDRSRDGEFNLTPPPGGYVPEGAAR